MQTLWAKRALTPQGWFSDVQVTIDDGKIADCSFNCKPSGERFDILLPAPANLHSHAFQRAMAGMTEWKNADSSDDFWAWRRLMYQFLDRLTPNDVLAVAAQVQMEMLEAGYAAVGEFHYLHHQPDGKPYSDPAEMSAAIVNAAADSGIGLTLLPVLYTYGGCEQQPLSGEQKRFGCHPEQFLALWEGARKHLSTLPADAGLGVAPHSLRAAGKEEINFAAAIDATAPVHIHIAEQTKEVEEVQSAWGARPVEWLLSNADIDDRWCLIHATQMTSEETRALAQTKAVAGLCPITESNLGDGIFNGRKFMQSSGCWGIGSDSNVKIALAEELRTLEYSQRLRDRQRAVLSDGGSVGRFLFDHLRTGGAQALNRNSGEIKIGCLADLIALDGNAVSFTGLQDDTLLDAWIFASDDRVVRDVWSAGRHLVKDGRHIHRERIFHRFQETLQTLRGQV